MTKAALDRAYTSLAEEVREHDIAVNVLSPGKVDTWMNRRGHWPGTEHIPMDQPDTIRDAALWLAGIKAPTSPATASSEPNSATPGVQASPA